MTHRDGFPPTRPLARRIACTISMGHYQRDLVLIVGRTQYYDCLRVLAPAFYQYRASSL